MASGLADDWEQPDELRADGPGEPTPESAAAGDVADRYVTHISTSIDPSGDYALVLLGMDAGTDLYGDESFCYRRSNRWYQAWSGNGNQFYPPLGLYSDWGEAPKNAIGARVSFQGTVYDCPAKGGLYHFVVWGWIRRSSRCTSELGRASSATYRVRLRTTWPWP